MDEMGGTDKNLPFSSGKVERKLGGVKMCANTGLILQLGHELPGREGWVNPGVPGLRSAQALEKIALKS